MKEQQARAFRFHSCARCGGDAYLDRMEEPADWRCLQCGRSIDARTRSADDGDGVRMPVADLEPAA
jgi:DNA-directed RNA polymerase subunit RPC12/RpoP